jgi:hypothetical protein
MARRTTTAIVVALTLGAAGCVSVRSYVEEGHAAAGYRDLQPQDAPLPVRLSVKFLHNGVPYPPADGELYNEVSRVLRDSGVMISARGDVHAALEVVVDDRYDENVARKRGLLTGLSEGGIASQVRDDYEFTLSFTQEGGAPRIGHYRHAIISVAGNQPPPTRGARALDPQDAFAVVVRQTVLDFLADVQGLGDSRMPVIMVPTTPAPPPPQ